jgi:uncharacterized phage protein (TIGR02218 family)
MAFTGADQDIVYDGVTYRASDGVGTTAIQQVAGTGIDNMDVQGVLTSARITEADMTAGLYDGARITALLVNRADLTMGAMTLIRGYLGEVGITDGQFRAEVRSLSAMLKQVTGDAATATCACHRLGDAQCKVSLSGNTAGGHAITRTTTVSSTAPGEIVTAVMSPVVPADHFTHGTIECLTGANAGLIREIKSQQTLGDNRLRIVTRRPFPHGLGAGVSIRLIAGCDRTIATCRAKFANANNFHGFDLLPTNDKVQKMGRPPAA